MDPHLEEEDSFYLPMNQKRFLSVGEEEQDAFKRQKWASPYSFLPTDPLAQPTQTQVTSSSSQTAPQTTQPQDAVAEAASQHYSFGLPMQQNVLTHYPTATQQQQQPTQPQQPQQQQQPYSSSFSFPFPPSSQGLMHHTNLQSGGQQQQPIDYRFSSSNQPPNPLLPVYYYASPPYLPRPSAGYQPQITTLHPHHHELARQSPHLMHHYHVDEGLESMYKLPNQSGLSTLANIAAVPAAGRKQKGAQNQQHKQESLKKKEGLEESASRIIALLQTRGKMIFKDIHESLGIDYRRAYDILNILLTTTLISKMGKKRENKLPFVYQDGNPLPEPVELRDIVGDVQKEEDLNKILKQRIQMLEEELAKEEPTPRFFASLKERDNLAANDPLYKDLV